MSRLATRFAVGLAAVLLCSAATGIGGTLASAEPGVAGASSTAAPAAAARAAVASLRVGAPIPGRRAGGGSSRVKGLSHISYFNWSGYADDHSKGNTYTMVSGVWKQPAVKCTKEDQIVVFWVGLDGFSNGTVEQDGTYAQCFEGVAHYFSWWEMFPTNEIQIVAAVHPGDTITSTVIFATGHYKLKVVDSTHPSGSFSTTQTCASGLTCSNTSAEWIAERPGLSTGLSPLANFASWTLTGAKVATASKTGTISTFPDDAINMIDSSSTYDLATVGALGAGGTRFGDTWKNSF